MKVAFVLGTRPEIIKLTSVIREVKHRNWPTHIIHTGQHYDHQMSEIFFRELNLPTPDVFLDIGSGSHGQQTGKALQRAEQALQEKSPDVVIVVGDTNSTVAGTLAALKLGIPVAHVEAGIRSFDWTMPEEINRRLVDALATVCFAPTRTAVTNLANEGRAGASHHVGDTLVEVALPAIQLALQSSRIVQDSHLGPGEYALMTLHRSENVDSPSRLTQILQALERLEIRLVFPIHPRAEKMFRRSGLLQRLRRCATLLSPLGYLDFLSLLKHARVVLTDSGGVQQESSILRVPCLTLRYNTEWIETVVLGNNRLLGIDPDRIRRIVTITFHDPQTRRAMLQAPSPFIPGAAAKIANILEDLLTRQCLEIPSANFIRDGIPYPTPVADPPSPQAFAGGLVRIAPEAGSAIHDPNAALSVHSNATLTRVHSQESNGMLAIDQEDQ